MFLLLNRGTSLFLFILLIGASAMGRPTSGTWHLEFVSNLHLIGNARHIAFKGHYAYVSLNWDGLAVVDISDPYAPRLIRTVNDWLTPLYITVDGDIGFEGDRLKGLQIIDLKVPEEPRLLSQVHSPSMVLHIFKTREFLYLACGKDGLWVMRRQPVEPFVSSVSSFTDVDYSKMLIKKEKTLYMADNRLAGFKVFDVSIASQPRIIGRYSTGGFCDVLAVKGDIIFISKRRAGIIIADISDPRNPHVIGHISRLNNTIKDIKVKGDMLYTANSQHGLEVFDVSVPEEPWFLTRTRTSGSSVNITLRDGLLYVADWDAGLTILRLVHKEK